MHLLVHGMGMSPEYVESMTWRMRKDIIEYHLSYLEEARRRQEVKR